MKYRAVLWDWDGTLFDSDYQVWRAMTAAYRQFNFPTEPYETFRFRESNHFDRGIGPLPRETIHQIRLTFREHFDTTSCLLVKHAGAVLRVLEERSILCAIISAHRRDDIMVKIGKHRILHHFEHVIGGAGEKTAALIETCKLLEIAPNEALFVGDLLCDVRDGKAAGVRTVLYAAHESPHIRHAHHHITDLRQLIGLLKD